MGIGYLIFIAVFFIGTILNSFGIFGELGDAFRMAFFLWPYPLILALQTWISTASNFWFAADLLGFGMVIIFGLYLQQLLKISNGSFYTRAWSVLLFPIPLILLQVFVALFVSVILGLPVGE